MANSEGRAPAPSAGKPTEPSDGARANKSPARDLAEKFRTANQATRLADPQLNAAAKAMAVANGHIDAAYKRGTPRNETAREMARDIIARNIEQGRSFTPPKITKPAPEREAPAQKEERSKDR